MGLRKAQNKGGYMGDFSEKLWGGRARVKHPYELVDKICHYFHLLYILQMLTTHTNSFATTEDPSKTTTAGESSLGEMGGVNCDLPGYQLHL